MNHCKNIDSVSLKLSIIVVSWNTRELLRKCLKSVYATVPPLAFEVIVIDNASSDGSADMVAECFPDTILVRSEVNLGFAAGNNLGIARSSTKYIMLLNPDAELLPGAVQKMVEFADDHTEAAIVGPKLLNSDGSLQKNGRKFPSLTRELLHITKIYRLSPRTFDRKWEWGRDDFDILSEVDEVCGACMLVRKSAIDSVGALDERFFMYYEEVDWCLRMKQWGGKIYYLPDAGVAHHAAQGSAQIGLAKNRMAYRSQYLYFMKNKGLVQALILRVLSALILTAMYVKQRIIGRRAKSMGMFHQ